MPDAAEDLVDEIEALKILSPRELVALRHVAKNHTRAEIAKSLGVRKNHVKNLLQSIRRKMKRELPPELLKRYIAIATYSPHRLSRPTRMASLSDLVNI